MADAKMMKVEVVGPVRPDYPQGYWRAGFRWPAGPTRIQVTTEQFAKLKADKYLSVRELGANEKVDDVAAPIPLATLAPEEKQVAEDAVREFRAWQSEQKARAEDAAKAAKK